MAHTLPNVLVDLPVIAPTEDAWRAMSPSERESLLVRILDALSDPAALMTEGRRHKKAKTRTIDALGLHFGAIGRAVYLAEEMAVLYPGEPVFSPNVLAVVGVTEPEDDARMAWVVADEGKGLDLVIEVLHHGSRNKDLVDNVERYAKLGIPEYFVYDRLHQRIHGYRLPDAGAQRYQRIVPQFGRHASGVLGLDLAIEGGSLRFFYGMAELPGTSDLIGRLNGMVADLEARAFDSQAQILEAQEQAAQALTALRGGIAALLGARGLVCSEEVQARLSSCSDAATLQRWLVRAMSAVTVEEVFAEGAGDGYDRAQRGEGQDRCAGERDWPPRSLQQAPREAPPWHRRSQGVLPRRWHGQGGRRDAPAGLARAHAPPRRDPEAVATPPRSCSLARRGDDGSRSVVSGRRGRRERPDRAAAVDAGGRERAASLAPGLQGVSLCGGVRPSAHGEARSALDRLSRSRGPRGDQGDRGAGGGTGGAEGAHRLKS